MVCEKRHQTFNGAPRGFIMHQMMRENAKRHIVVVFKTLLHQQCKLGIKSVRSHAHGDLLCHVVVETPVHLTERQKELLRELEESSQENSGRHNPRAKSWMDRVRDFFAAT